MKRPSAALVVASLALFVAISGAATAATHYLITSTKQINPTVLKKLQKAGPRGAKGATGAAGEAGVAGTPGTSGIAGIKYVTVSQTGSYVLTTTASCPTGYVAIGGSASPLAAATTISSTGYTAVSDLTATSQAYTETVTAVCATGPGIQTS